MVDDDDLATTSSLIDSKLVWAADKGIKSQLLLLTTAYQVINEEGEDRQTERRKFIL